MSRTVVVTGASDGIGLGIANMFLAAGDRVIGLSRTRPQTPDFTHVRCDLSAPESIDAALVELSSITDRVDVLVLNAGIRSDPVVSGDCAASMTRIRHLMDVNFIGHLVLTERLMESLVDEGRIITITSRSVYNGGDPAYIASKAALASLQVSLSHLLGSRGVTVNSVAPGFVPDTGMMRDRISLERKTRESRKTPVGRLGTVADISAAVFFVATEEARYLNGTTLILDGGETKRI